MKIKHFLALFIIGFFISILGALFKILHWEFGYELASIGFVLRIMAVILIFWKLTAKDKLNEFLNW